MIIDKIPLMLYNQLLLRPWLQSTIARPFSQLKERLQIVEIDRRHLFAFFFQERRMIMRISPMPVFVSLLLLLISFHGEVLAQCSTSLTNDDTNIGIRSFGRQFAENVNVEIGNSFLLDCPAQFLSIEASFVFPEGTINEHPPLALGDILYCSIRDQNRDSIMTEQIVIPLADLDQKLTFDFSAHEFKLAAGQYYFMIGTLQDRYGYVDLGSEYADGASQVTIDGVWYEQVHDTMFHMFWDPDSPFVPAKDMSWGTMKAFYR